MQVFVLDQNRKPLDPCSPARARYLLVKGRAAVFRRFPFTIILQDRTAEESVVHPHRLKLDPGSKVTGLVILHEPTSRVVLAAEIAHRGAKIRAALAARRAVRRSRRQRKTRYRPARFDNRRRRAGWLPPSLKSRVANVLTWVSRLRRLSPVAALSTEVVRFDLQLLENPEISGVEYQQGTLAGYELREYLLEKWERRCAYCGREGVPLQIDHLQAKRHGGTNRVTNLTLSCQPCNQAKGDQDVAQFLKRKPEVLQRILAQAHAPLRDAAAVNATRWELFQRLKAAGLEVESGTGGRTKYNRSRLGLPKTHWLDAACVGASTPEELKVAGVRLLEIKACGHGRRNRCWTDRHGFPVRHALRTKSDRGFRTGDIVEAVIPSGKHPGRHRGRVAIRFGQNFQVGEVSVHPRHLRKLHRADGYDYSLGETFVSNPAGGAAPPTAEARGFPPRRSL
jgi:5-methylcytosine-specific restriction endonuclease McrA